MWSRHWLVRLFAVLGVFHHVLSTGALLCAFLKLLTVFDLFIAPGTMFQASTTLQHEISELISIFVGHF